MENRLIDSLRRADRFWLLDGAMGTQLQKKLVAAGRSILGLIPELCCITEPELVTQVHREYLEAGADILYTNTFGANRKKLTGSGYTPQQIIPAGVGCAKQAATGEGHAGCFGHRSHRRADGTDRAPFPSSRLMTSLPSRSMPVYRQA